jgi:hypothetical protein
MEVLRVGHGSHEHGKDVIAVDTKGKVHAYQLKDGNLGLDDYEKLYAQVQALVETQVEHPQLRSAVRHESWLVISGEATMPAEDRIRVHNLKWKGRKLGPLRLMTGRTLVRKFVAMSANFWPQKPEDSRSLLSLYLADGLGVLDRSAFAKLITDVVATSENAPKTEVARRISAANIFTNYALSSFYRAKNHWEVIQGWTITASAVAWAANKACLSLKNWRPVFRIAVEAALGALSDACDDTLEPHALFPNGFELDELTRSRSMICAGLLAAKILLCRIGGDPWSREAAAASLLKKLIEEGRMLVWGEGAIPFMLMQMWAFDNLQADFAGDRYLFASIGAILQLSSPGNVLKIASPYSSADKALARIVETILGKSKLKVPESAASYYLETLVFLAARRLWKNLLSGFWLQITYVDLIQIAADEPADLLLWHWGHGRGVNQSRRFGTPQSWSELLASAREPADHLLPPVLKDETDFALLFTLCIPHRFNSALARHFEAALRGI